MSNPSNKVGNPVAKDPIFYMMNMPPWFIEADEDTRINIVNDLLGPSAPPIDAEYSKQEIQNILNNL